MTCPTDTSFVALGIRRAQGKPDADRTGSLLCNGRTHRLVTTVGQISRITIWIGRPDPFCASAGAVPAGIRWPTAAHYARMHVLDAGWQARPNETTRHALPSRHSVAVATDFGAVAAKSRSAPASRFSQCFEPKNHLPRATRAIQGRADRKRAARRAERLC